MCFANVDNTSTGDMNEMEKSSPHCAREKTKKTPSAGAGSEPQMPQVAGSKLLDQDS